MLPGNMSREVFIVRRVYNAEDESRMNGISGQSATPPARRRQWYVPNLGVRILIALAIALLVVMVFFATSAVSH